MQITRAVLKRGEIYCADLNPVIGSEQGGIRPVLIIQNDVGNKYSPTIIIAAITSRLEKTNLLTHVQLDDLSSGLERNSIALLEQIRTIDRARLKEYKGHLNPPCMSAVDRALSISFGLEQFVGNQKCQAEFACGY